MKLVLVISSLSCGGSERVLSEMANYWSQTGHEVTLLTLDDGSSHFYQLNPTVKWYPLNLLKKSENFFQAVGANFQRIAVLRTEIRKVHPDVVISFLYATNIMVLLASAFSSFPVIVSERNHPAMKKESPRGWSHIRKLMYPRARHLVVQTNSIKNWFIGYNKSIPIIHNPIGMADSSLNEAPEIPLPAGRFATAMGSLSHQKGFDILIKIFTRLLLRFPDWELVILGEGALRKDLEDQVKKLGAVGKIRFPGSVKNPTTVLKRSDLFLFSSRYEGFPNALLEAMACGLPVVSFDCPSGPADMIRNGENGMLVPLGNSDELEQVAAKLMADPSKRKQLAKEAQKVQTTFSREAIMAEWTKLLN
ncbi:MAG: group 1 glycosyl transferase [SAR324 cluster bacterium]|uniref:Group 1 glycosyl transferase n=1 Tax=SAR324 cluster bacterium TaxID=2024889 RepID=A0A2A4T7V4_9DELT|nr:MAG: group 1 glycosyl transferase [SAR324 cluster bacterium]